MNVVVIVPVFNEEKTIGKTLNSLIEQTYLPTQIIVVDDHSTDNSLAIIKKYSGQYAVISVVTHRSKPIREPGAKVIDAFYVGFDFIKVSFDIVCKFDGDIILPPNYIQSVVDHFKSNSKLGIYGGKMVVRHNNYWKPEGISDHFHVRGPIKAYRKACFYNIGGLKRERGWDTVDVLLARYFNWEVYSDKNLKVKHLKTTAIGYASQHAFNQGTVFYRLRYGIGITLIAILKQFSFLGFEGVYEILKGYIYAKRHLSFLLNESQGKFVRRYRWKNIFKKLGF